MKHTKSLVLFAVLAAASMSACSGLGDDGVNFGGGASGGGGTTNATFGVTLQAKPLALPANATILSYSLTIGDVTLTPASGNPINVSGSATFDLTRLQSDSALLATFSAPAGTYSGITLSLSSATVTYCTVTTGVPGCNTGSVLSATAAPATPVIAFPGSSLVLSSGQETGTSIYFDMGGTLTVVNQAITKVDLTQANLTTIPLGPSHLSSLSSTQLDYLEDVIGNVTVSGNQVTITTHNSVQLITTADSNTFYSPNCNNTGIGDGTNTINCVQTNQLASINAGLNEDGTLELLSYDPLAPVSTTNNDWIEGIVVYTPTNPAQLTIVANDAAVTSSGTVLPNPFPIAAPITVNFQNNNPFVNLNVDTQGLQVPADFTNFVGTATPATTLLAGQTVAFHVLTYTAGSPASITTDNAILRFTRIAGNASQGGVVNNFTYDSTTLPAFYSFATPSQLVELTAGTPPTTNSTNYDGISNSTGITTGSTYSVRALFFGQFDAFPFVAAKVRQNQ